MTSPTALEVYRSLHRRPELSGAEERTAAALAALLGDVGFDVRTGVGGHGVVAALKNGDGPVVAVRAELDALPVTEETELAWASEEPGVMHACGHDLHLACAVAAATELAADPDSWSGTLLVLLQPAEETLTGARAMAADGVYDRWRPDVVLAQHLAPFPAGYLAHGTGPTECTEQLSTRGTSYCMAHARTCATRQQQRGDSPPHPRMTITQVRTRCREPGRLRHRMTSRGQGLSPAVRRLVALLQVMR